MKLLFKLESRSSQILAALVFLFSSLVFWTFVNTIAYNENHFVDEMTYHQAPTNFFTTGRYSTLDFPRPFSTSAGPLVTWPAFVGWMLFDNLYEVRLFIASVNWLFFLFVACLALGKIKRLTIVSSLAIASLSTLLFTRLPYYGGFILNLGELTSFLMIGISVFYWRRYPGLSVSLLSANIILGKTLLAPLILSVFLWILINDKHHIARHCLFFLLPPTVLGLFLLIVFGTDELFEWSRQYVQIVGYFFNEGTAKESLTEVVPFAKRLQLLEWNQYGIAWKFFIVFFSFYAVLYSLINLPKKFTWRLLVIFASANILLFCAWYFLWHPKMFIRHLQPALLTGFALILLTGLGNLEKKTSAGIKAINAVTFAFIVLIVAHQSTKVFSVYFEKYNDRSYASECTDIFGKVCLSQFKYQTSLKPEM